MAARASSSRGVPAWVSIYNETNDSGLEEENKLFLEELHDANDNPIAELEKQWNQLSTELPPAVPEDSDVQDSEADDFVSSTVEAPPLAIKSRSSVVEKNALDRSSAAELDLDAVTKHESVVLDRDEYLNSQPSSPRAENPSYRHNDTIVCFTCGSQIQDRVISALGKTYHVEHFKCSFCNDVLSREQFYERDGKPLCFDCQRRNENFVLCVECGLSIDGQRVSALNHSWHKACFACRSCGAKLPDMTFFTKEDWPICSTCALPPCADCHRPMTNDQKYLKACGNHYHRGCFCCTHCKKPLGTDYFYEFDGEPWCSKECHSGVASKCYSCKGAITGGYASALGRQYHIEHLVCSQCNTQLTGSKFVVADNDTFFCQLCRNSQRN